MKLNILSFFLVFATANAGSCSDFIEKEFSRDHCGRKNRESKCQGNAVCEPHNGKYKCICPAGYEGLGHCPEDKNGCTDIDECADANAMALTKDGIEWARSEAKALGWEVCSETVGYCVNEIGSSSCKIPCDELDKMQSTDFTSQVAYDALKLKCDKNMIDSACDLINHLGSNEDLALFGAGLSLCPGEEMCTHGGHTSGPYKCELPLIPDTRDPCSQVNCAREDGTKPFCHRIAPGGTCCSSSYSCAVGEVFNEEVCGCVEDCEMGKDYDVTTSQCESIEGYDQWAPCSTAKYSDQCAAGEQCYDTDIHSFQCCDETLEDACEGTFVGHNCECEDNRDASGGGGSAAIPVCEMGEDYDDITAQCEPIEGYNPLDPCSTTKYSSQCAANEKCYFGGVADSFQCCLATLEDACAPGESFLGNTCECVVGPSFPPPPS